MVHGLFVFHVSGLHEVHRRPGLLELAENSPDPQAIGAVKPPMRCALRTSITLSMLHSLSRSSPYHRNGVHDDFRRGTARGMNPHRSIFPQANQPAEGMTSPVFSSTRSELRNQARRRPWPSGHCLLVSRGCPQHRVPWFQERLRSAESFGVGCHTPQPGRCSSTSAIDSRRSPDSR